MGSRENAVLSSSVFDEIGKIPISYCSIGRYVAAAEFFSIIVLAAFSSAGYHYAAFEHTGNLKSFTSIGLACAILYVLAMQAQHFYRPFSIVQQSCVPTLTTWLGVFCIMLVFAFIARLSQDFSRGATLAFFLSGGIVLPLGRNAARKILSYSISKNRLGGRKHVVLFGDRRQLSARGISDNLNRHGYKVTSQFGILIDENDSISSYREISSNFELLRRFVQENRVDEIFLVFATGNDRLIDLVSDRLSELPIPARLLFDNTLSRFLSQDLIDLGAAKAVRIQKGPLSSFQQAVKRTLDIVGSSVGLLLLAPLFFAIAVAIRLDSRGPVLFRQRRAGFGGRTFRIYKFRSMSTLDDGDVVLQATRHDARVTRIGRYLRRSSLDELPQLINVLRGDMSLVGPRPHALSHDNQYVKQIATYALRHHMKPGITGWAQVNGCRGETSTLESMSMRVKLDIWYIVHWTIFLDLKAIVLTVVQLFRPKDVY